MKNLSVLKKAILLCMAMLFLYACEEKKKEKQPETSYILASTDSTTTPCDCNSDWFPHTQTPPPAEGKGSPFDAKETTNCIFHQWSWQKFLWLTIPDTTGSKTPLFLRDKSITQVDPYMNPVKIPSGLSLVLTADNQAGSAGILKSNPNFNTSGTVATVYYAIYMDSIMNNAAKKYAALLQSGKLDSTNTKTFPVGSLELKTSWISTEVIPEADRANYYTTNASVNGTTMEVAMLGMHVVGVVENHPEFIWATFEHTNLAPAFDWTKGTASADTEKLLFKKGSVSTVDGIYWDHTTNAPKTASQAYSLFEYGVPRVKGESADANFMATSQSEPENYDNVKHINECVAEQLKDVWNNYAYDGSIWINTDELSPQEQADLLVKVGDTLGNATPGSIARGSLNSANISMETYTQTFNTSLDQINASNLVNCLSCHSAQSFSSGQPRSPLYISHVFNGYLEHLKGTPHPEIEKLKMKEFQKAFLKQHTK